MSWGHPLRTSHTFHEDMKVLDMPDSKFWKKPGYLTPEDLLPGGGESAASGAGRKGLQKPRPQLGDILPDILERPKYIQSQVDDVIDELIKEAKAPQEDQGWQEKYEKDVWSRTLPFGEQIVDRRTNQTHTIPSPFLPALVGNPITLNNPALKGLPFWARIGISAGEKGLRLLRDWPWPPSTGGSGSNKSCEELAKELKIPSKYLCNKESLSIKGSIFK